MEVKVGEVTHFFGKISVAVLALMEELKEGDEIHILGRTTDFSQKVASMQVDHEAVETGHGFSAIGQALDRQRDDIALLHHSRTGPFDAV